MQLATNSMTFGICALSLTILAACAPVKRWTPGPQPGAADYEARTNCMFRETAKQISRYQAQHLNVDMDLSSAAIATSVTGICSGDIWMKMQRATPTPSVDDSNYAIERMEIDRLETEQYAESIVRSQLKTLQR
ncbi:hypothetical protein [Burkholderia sp. Ax-1724]|uniref:hypothetical protein n=1 Tax=Burkholderia sp. Ax-1724 TaxID=2608336 RepID=UPI00142180E7|nr:hypothetical protein [Burkholderia sp. Ax-1724]NIF51430.1 hypothetical protein [Burkholderia sp. Ax-1724]